MDLLLGCQLGDGGAGFKRLLDLYGTTEPHPGIANLNSYGPRIENDVRHIEWLGFPD